MKAGGPANSIVLCLGLALIGSLSWATPTSPADLLPGLTRPGGAAGIGPGKGVFLVANESIGPGPFHRSVVLLLNHESQGTLGLIVNRETEMPLYRLIPDLGRDGAESPTLFFGGPVGLDSLICLFRAEEAKEGAEHVMDDGYYTGSRRVLEGLLREMGPDRLRVYIGHSGWGSGQLASEIARGDWQLLRADAATVFESFTEGIWHRLSRPTLPSIVDGRLPLP